MDSSSLIKLGVVESENAPILSVESFPAWRFVIIFFRLVPIEHAPILFVEGLPACDQFILGFLINMTDLIRAQGFFFETELSWRPFLLKVGVRLFLSKVAVRSRSLLKVAVHSHLVLKVAFWQSFRLLQMEGLPPLFARAWARFLYLD